MPWSSVSEMAAAIAKTNYSPFLAKPLDRATKASVQNRLLKYTINTLLALGACARITAVVVCVSVSVTALPVTNLVWKSQVQFYKVAYGISIV